MISNKIITKEFFMELVYLWVEDYKNIQKQGFNFSPRFRCEFKDEYEKYIDTYGKGKERLKDDCKLIIDEKKDFVSIFSENINVTAIVGENGSGKSSILNYLINVFHNESIRDIKKDYLCIIWKDNKINILSTIENVNIICIKEYKYYFDSIRNINKDIKDFLLQQSCNFYHYSIAGNYIVNSELRKNIYPNKRLSGMDIEKQDLKKIIYKVIEENSEDYFENYFFIDQIIIQSNSLYNPLITKKVDRKYFENISILSDELNKESNVDKFLFITYTYLSSLLVDIINGDNFYELCEVKSLNEFEEVLEKKIYGLMNSITHTTGILQAGSLNYKERLLYVEDIFSNYLKVIKEFREDIEELFGREELNSVYNSIRLNIKKEKIRNKKYKFIFEKLPDCFDINFRDIKKDIEYLNLSNGEKSIIRIRYYIESKIRQKDIKQFIFLFDELEVEIHPQWQKQIINYLSNIFKNRIENIHFIISSHSPFILSDLPKENIIFLEKGKQVYPFENGQTFGANIHTLLSHGFFMKDGLMGEFAKSKIDIAIKYLNQKILTPKELDYCENIISIIGEPIIKRELQRKLDSKRLSKIDKIDEIEEQMKLLAHRLEMIRKNQK